MHASGSVTKVADTQYRQTLGRCAIPQCPDCDSVKPSSDPPQRDGRCAGCHGSGFGAFVDIGVMESPNAEQPVCEECYGTGKCQTCRGTGVIEEHGTETTA